MFTPGYRDELRRRLVDRAAVEPEITAAALVGSGARGTTDQWSDLDLALRLATGAELDDVADQWTRFLYDELDAADHVDIKTTRALYRVFILPNSLQVDLSFWTSDAFAGNGEPFELLFGEANPPTVSPAPTAHGFVGMGWLYALHARAAIARQRRWQAMHMLNGMRDQVTGLACLRFDLPPHQGRGVDALPEEIIDHLGATLVRSLGTDELTRAFAALAAALLAETELVDGGLEARLRHPLMELVESSR